MNQSAIQNVIQQTARLLAQENITVEFVPGCVPSFCTKSRNLRLPIYPEQLGWASVDALQCHEIGHAVYTAPDEWQSAINTYGLPFCRKIVNSIEDIRIEKMVCRKYPGAARAFRLGWAEIRKHPKFVSIFSPSRIAKADLAGRLYMACSMPDLSGVRFSEEEMEAGFLERAQNLETFQDVLALSLAIRDWELENPNEQPEPEDEPEQGGQWIESEDGKESNEQQEGEGEGEQQEGEEQEGEERNGNGSGKDGEEEEQQEGEGNGGGKDGEGEEKEGGNGNGKDGKEGEEGEEQGGGKDGDGQDAKDGKGKDGGNGREGGNGDENQESFAEAMERAKESIKSNDNRADGISVLNPDEDSERFGKWYAVNQMEFRSSSKGRVAIKGVKNALDSYLGL